MAPMDRRTRVLVVAIIVSFIAFLDGAVINVALPSIAAELGGGLALQQWAVDAYLLTLGSLILLAGSLSDSFGRLRIIRIGLYGFAATSVFCALAPDGVVFVVGRAPGRGRRPAGAEFARDHRRDVPACRAGPRDRTLDRVDHRRLPGRPLLGGILVDLASWRLAFWINVRADRVVLVLMRVLGRDEPNMNRERIDWIGAALGIIGLGGTVFALIEQGRFGWESPVVLVPLMVGLVALVAFVVWERRAPQPMLPLTSSRCATSRRQPRDGLHLRVVHPRPLRDDDLPPGGGRVQATMAGLATLPPTVMLVLLGAWFGALSTRFGPRIFMTLGPIIVAAGYLLTLTVQPR